MTVCDTSWFRRTVRDARCIVGYKHSADTGQRAAQRNENSPSETFNINLLWCEFTWVPVKVRVRAAGSLTTASQGCGECERSGWSGRAHRWLQLSLLFCPAERFFFFFASRGPAVKHGPSLLKVIFPPAWSVRPGCLRRQRLFSRFHCCVRVAVGEGKPTAMPVLCQLALAG